MANQEVFLHSIVDGQSITVDAITKKLKSTPINTVQTGVGVLDPLRFFARPASGATPAAGITPLAARNVMRGAAQSVMPEDFGAVGDNIADDIVALQAAVDYAIANSVPLILRGHTTYLISDTLRIGFGAGVSTIVMRGQTPGNGFNAGSRIHCTHNKHPAIALQGIWDSHFAYFTVECENTANGPNYSNNPDISAYVTSGFSIDQWRPHCGIVVDPCTGASPPGGGYSGFTYGQVASSHIEFDHVDVYYCVVGFWVYGGGGGGSDEFLASSIRYERCNVHGAAVGYSSTSTQSRNISYVDCRGFGLHTAFDGRTFGLQHGVPPRIEGFEADNCWTAFNIQTDNDTFKCYGFFAEALQTLGIFVGDKAATFSGADFEFLGGADFGGLPYPILHCRQSAPMSFIGCSFAVASPFVNFWSGGFGARKLNFDECTVRASNGYETFPMFLAHRIAGSVVGSAVSVHRSNISVLNVTGIDGYNTDSDVYTPNFVYQLSQHARRVRTYGTAAGYLGDGDMTVKLSSGQRCFQLAGAAYSWVNGTLTFTATAGEFIIGHILYWYLALKEDGGSPLADQTHSELDKTYQDLMSVPALKVTNVVGTTVTAVAIGDYTELNRTLSPAQVQVCAEEWAPVATLTATWNTGSKTIVISNAAATFRAGMFLKAAAGLPAIVHVVSQAGANVVLSKFPTGNKTDEPIYCSKVVPV